MQPGNLSNRSRGFSVPDCHAAGRVGEAGVRHLIPARRAPSAGPSGGTTRQGPPLSSATPGGGPISLREWLFIFEELLTVAGGLAAGGLLLALAWVLR